MSPRFYDVFTIRDGTIARLEEYTTREGGDGGGGASRVAAITQTR